MSHSANHDPRTGLRVGGAIHTLLRWLEIFGAAVCGTQALIHLFTVMRLQNAAIATIQRQILRSRTDGPSDPPRDALIAHVRETLHSLPEKELERIGRAMRLETSMSSDDPPMAWRLNLLEANTSKPRVKLQADAHTCILAELKPLEVTLSRQLFERLV